ncbi:MAG: hypothetical protein HY820_43850 [Acidobacteria bacterium]|nr:hypothetical protein [Acidobacteriota bacterium]
MSAEQIISVPGRVNLIGEHIDYHNLPVLPVALDRRIRVRFRALAERRIRCISDSQSTAGDFAWTEALEPGPAGDWLNYVKAAAQAVHDRWAPGRGIEAAVESDLPLAAGLSSSSALLVGITLALLRANEIEGSFEELMAVLPEAEYFVGTRGGGMDHAAVLAARRDCALLIRFAPVTATPVPVPKDWVFLAAHSLTTAEKSTALRAEYNVRRTAGNAALVRLGLRDYREALNAGVDTAMLEDSERRAFAHVVSEARRVEASVAALGADDPLTFGRLLNESQASLSGLLRVSTPQLDRLTALAVEGGALGARLTGAGFGGFAVILCQPDTVDGVREHLVRHYYADKAFDARMHLLTVRPSDGALMAGGG